MGNMHSHWAYLGISILLATCVSARIDSSGDAGYAPEDYQICNYTATYDSLGDLNLDLAESGVDSIMLDPLFTPKGTMRTDCVEYYALDALINMLQTAYNNYTVVDDGYDKEFGYYITYMQNLVPEVLQGSFMFDTANATDTMNMAPVGPGMAYFDCETNGSKFSCTDLGDHDHVESAAFHTTALTLKTGMQDAYNAALTKAGITPDWVQLGDQTISHDMVAGRAGRRWQYKFTGFPVAKADFNITNPKDIVTKALPNIPNLQTDMQATLVDIMLGTWANGSVADASQAYGTPVFMFMQAVENMAQVKALGEKEQKLEEQERRNLIIMILSVVLMFVPVIGEEAATAAGFATIARSIAIAGEAGNAALGIYDTVNNPSSAFVNILGMLIGVGAVAKVSRDGPGLSKVARTAETMSADTVANLGTVFKDGVDDLGKALKFCKSS